MPLLRALVFFASLALAAWGQSCALQPAADMVWGSAQGLLVLEGDLRRPLLRVWDAGCRETAVLDLTTLITGARRVSVSDAARLEGGRVAIAVSYDGKLGRSGRALLLASPIGEPLRLPRSCRALAALAGGGFLCLEPDVEGTSTLLRCDAEGRPTASLALPFKRGDDDPYLAGRLGLPQLLAGGAAAWLWLPALESLLEAPLDGRAGRWERVEAPAGGRALLSFTLWRDRLLALLPASRTQAERFDTRYRLYQHTSSGWRALGGGDYSRGARLAGAGAAGVWLWDRTARRAFVAAVPD